MATEKHKCPYCAKEITVSGYYKRVCVDGSCWYETMFYPYESDKYVLGEKECYGCQPVYCSDKCKRSFETTQKKLAREKEIKWIKEQIKSYQDKLSEIERGL